MRSRETPISLVAVTNPNFGSRIFDTDQNDAAIADPDGRSVCSTSTATVSGASVRRQNLFLRQTELAADRSHLYGQFCCRRLGHLRYGCSGRCHASGRDPWRDVCWRLNGHRTRRSRQSVVGQCLDRGVQESHCRSGQRCSYLQSQSFTGRRAGDGDFDGDGDVDGRDFLVWQRGESPNPLSAGDLTLWQDTYGTGGLAAVVAVPEPSSVMLVLGCVFSMVGATRSRR